MTADRRPHPPDTCAWSPEAISRGVKTAIRERDPVDIIHVIANVAKRSSRSEPSGDRSGPAHPLTFAEVEQAPDPPPLAGKQRRRLRQVGGSVTRVAVAASPATPYLCRDRASSARSGVCWVELLRA